MTFEFLKEQIEAALLAREKALGDTVPNWGDGTYDAIKGAVEMSIANLRIARREIIPPIIDAYEEKHRAENKDNRRMTTTAREVAEILRIAHGANTVESGYLHPTECATCRVIIWLESGKALDADASDRGAEVGMR